MDPLETLLRPLVRALNRNIGESTPARELCQQLDGKTIAVRVRDTGLAMVFAIDDEVLDLRTGIKAEPDVVLTGSLVTLAKMAGPNGHDHSPAALQGGLDISGDAFTAQAFQKLLKHARPDPEEELHTAQRGDPDPLPAHPGRSALRNYETYLKLAPGEQKAYLLKLDDDGWQRHLAARHYHDAVKRNALIEQPALIPDKLARIRALVRLRYGTPHQEVDARVERIMK